VDQEAVSRVARYWQRQIWDRYGKLDPSWGRCNAAVAWRLQCVHEGILVRMIDNYRTATRDTTEARYCRTLLSWCRLTDDEWLQYHPDNWVEPPPVNPPTRIRSTLQPQTGTEATQADASAAAREYRRRMRG
jgi:hypothetical protein